MPCDGATSHSEDQAAYTLSAAYAILLAACLELSFRVVRTHPGLFSRHQRLFIVLVAFVAGLRALAFALEPALYPRACAWQPEDKSQPGFAALATLPRLLFFCAYSVLVYTYLVDHRDFANSRARDGRAPRRLAAWLVACNAPGLIMQVSYCGAVFAAAAEDTITTLYDWYIYVFVAESLLLSVLFVGYGVALYTWYNEAAFFQGVEFNVVAFVDHRKLFNIRKHQVAFASLGCSVAFITKGCLLLAKHKFALFNNEWHYELLSSLLGEVLPALFMICMLRRPAGGGGGGGELGGGGGEMQDLQEALTASDTGGDGAPA